MTDVPNIVLLTVDSLRADRWGPVADDESQTPTLDRLGDDGLVFTNAIAPGPTTSDSVPVMMTGEGLHGRSADPSQDTRDWLRHHMRARRTLPERLSDLGYETAAFTANPWTSRYFGFEKGFDRFEDFLDDGPAGDPVPDDADSTLGYVKRLLSDWSDGENMFKSWPGFYGDVLSWRDAASEPYFLWLFLVDVHMPYLPPRTHSRHSRVGQLAANLWLYLAAPRFAPLFRETLVDTYDDTVRWFDATLERFLDDFSRDDPIYVIHGDHGEEFGEHGVYGHGPNLTEEQIHTPLVIGNGPTGRIDAPFSLSRLPALVTKLARDEDVTDLAGPTAISRNWDPKVAVRGRSWKYVETPTDRTLYDVPGESETLEDEELASVARDIVRRWRSDCLEREQLATAAERVVSGGHV